MHCVSNSAEEQNDHANNVDGDKTCNPATPVSKADPSVYAGIKQKGYLHHMPTPQFFHLRRIVR